MRNHTCNISILIGATVLVRLLYYGFFFLVYNLNPDLQKSVSHGVNDFLALFSRNDSDWYELIFTEGYPAEDPRNICTGCQSAWAFFPLYPAFLKAIALLMGTSFTQSAFIFSLFIAPLMLSQFYLFLNELGYEIKMALRASLLLMVMPFHYYFFTYYTEALFLFLVLASFRALRYNWFFLASFLLALLVMVRPNGIICIPAIALFSLENKYNELRIKELLSIANLKSLVFVGIKLTAIPMIFFAAFCYYQYLITGNPFAFKAAQAGWNRSFNLPVFAFFRQGDWQTQVLSVYTILCVIVCVSSSIKQSLSFTAFMWFNILLPLSTSSVLSMPRFFSVNFPFQIGIFKRLNTSATTLILVFILQLLTFYFWIVKDPFSF